MKKNKLNETIYNLLDTLDRAKIELFLISILYDKLENINKKNYSIEELRMIMNSMPHFDAAEQFMMLSTYEQKQIFITYKQVFLSIISELPQYPVSGIKQVIKSYLDLGDVSELEKYYALISVRNLAA